MATMENLYFSNSFSGTPNLFWIRSAKQIVGSVRRSTRPSGVIGTFDFTKWLSLLDFQQERQAERRENFFLKMRARYEHLIFLYVQLVSWHFFDPINFGGIDYQMI
jgi:hypothetical protein